MTARPDYNFDRVSPTQIKRKRRCDRKWYFTAVLGIRFPSSGAQRLSRELHSETEDTIKGEARPESPEVISALRHKATPPADRILAAEIDLRSEDADVSLAGVDISGIVDAVWIENDGERIVVNDWKFRASIGDETREDVANSPQLILYARAIVPWAIDRGYIDSPPPEVELRITESLKSDRGGPATNVIRSRVSWATIRQRFRRLERDVRSMQSIARRGLPGVPPDRRRCWDYGPCDHMNLCHSVPFDPLFSTATTTEDDMPDVADLADGQGLGDDGDDNSESEPGDEIVEEIEDDLDAVLDDPEELEEPEEDTSPFVPEDLLEEYRDKQLSPGEEFDLDDYDLAPAELHDFCAAFDEEFGVGSFEAGFPDAAEEVALFQSAEEVAIKLEAISTELTVAAETVLDVADADELLAKPAADAAESIVEDPESPFEEPTPDPEPTEDNDDSPSFRPGDHEPDRDPESPDEIAVEDFSWGEISGVGDKTADQIESEVVEAGYSTIGELIDEQFDFASVDGLGDKRASTVADAIREAEPFEPDDEPPSSLEIAVDVLQDRGYEIDVETVRENFDAERIRKTPGAADLIEEELGLDDETDPVEKAREQTDGVPPEQTGKLTLYVNCAPIDADAEFDRLEVLLEELGLIEATCEHLERTEDVEEVNYWDELPYQRGPKALAGRVLEHVDKFDGRTIVVDSDHSGADQIVQILGPRADKIVRAFH